MIDLDDEERKMPKTVLVPLDGTPCSKRALPVAEQLADRFDADTVVIAADLAHAEPASEVDAAGNGLPLPRRNLRVEVVQSLTVADAVRAVADDSNDPVVCMATHARTMVGHALFGSVAEEVVRGLDGPAVLVGPASGTTLRQGGPLLVCHDGSTASDAIVAIARDWAHALRTNIALVHVFHPLDVETAVDPEAVVGAAASQLAVDLDVDVRVVRGYSPAGTIVGLVDEIQPVLVALTTHGRTGLARVALGSVAMAVVRRSSCPALVVRPPLTESETR
jgi:nucleotide-binding universal stress UspA family protein